MSEVVLCYTEREEGGERRDVNTPNRVEEDLLRESRMRGDVYRLITEVRSDPTHATREDPE